METITWMDVAMTLAAFIGLGIFAVFFIGGLDGKSLKEIILGKP